MKSPVSVYVKFMMLEENDPDMFSDTQHVFKSECYTEHRH